MVTKTILYISDERCLYCNEVIPEGRMVCPACEEKLIYSNHEKKNVKYIHSKSFLKKILNQL